jgi:beta-xylosidase
MQIAHLRSLALGFWFLFSPIAAQAQTEHAVWQPDLGNGRYKNPVLYADYSDPDVIRVGDDYYLTASSFTCMPTLPILHSKDLVNWTILGHVADGLPLERYRKPQHGEGTWAPALRYHNGLFYNYVCSPNDGLWCATARKPEGPWKIELVEAVGKWEDPCPFWDEDGQAYLIHSRVGAGNLTLHRMSKDGKRLLDNGKVIVEDPVKLPVLEGPKLYKNDGWYYILAPIGGVSTGQQVVLRSRKIDGPYETKTVLHQGKTAVNGPHQGGMVQTQTGEWWFLHFQSKAPWGRVVHLQPVSWVDGWPLMGQLSDSIGVPVAEYRKPDVGRSYPRQAPQTSDEFDRKRIGLQWQWNANVDPSWYSLTKKAGSMRLYARKEHHQVRQPLLYPEPPASEIPGTCIFGHHEHTISAEKGKRTGRFGGFRQPMVLAGG